MIHFKKVNHYIIFKLRTEYDIFKIRGSAGAFLDHFEHKQQQQHH